MRTIAATFTRRRNPDFAPRRRLSNLQQTAVAIADSGSLKYAPRMVPLAFGTSSLASPSGAPLRSDSVGSGTQAHLVGRVRGNCFGQPADGEHSPPRSRGNGGFGPESALRSRTWFSLPLSGLAVAGGGPTGGGLPRAAAEAPLAGRAAVRWSRGGTGPQQLERGDNGGGFLRTRRGCDGHVRCADDGPCHASLAVASCIAELAVYICDSVTVGCCRACGAAVPRAWHRSCRMRK